MTRPRNLRLVRRGFTLVELMVATALVVLILTILAVAFGTSTETFSRLRSMGDMAERLRTSKAKLRSDLESQHFEGGTSPVGLKLSDLKYNQLTSGGSQVVPPSAGYFRIVQGSGSIYEGQDAEGAISTKAVNHSLEFTVKRQGTGPDDLFVIPTDPASVALRSLNVTDTPFTANQFVGNWARVRWYLDNPQTVKGVPTWTLYRCVRAIAPGNVALTASEQELFAHVSGTSQTLAQLSDPNTRTATLPIPLPGTVINRYQPGTTFYGDDIVLTNVTSFEVKPIWEAGSGVRTPRLTMPVTAIDAAINDGGPVPAVPNTVNTDAPFDDLPVVTENGPGPTGLNGQRVFDTWSVLSGWNVPGTLVPAPGTPNPNALPLRIRITALQIRVRVFDTNNLMSRQLTFIVKL